MNHSQIPIHIRELLDVCRDEQMLAEDVNMQPLRDWIDQDPGRRNYWDEIRLFDSKVANAFDSADIPIDLTSRVLDRIRTSINSNGQAKDTTLNGSSPTESGKWPVELDKTNTGIFARRRMRNALVGFAAMAACIALVSLGMYLSGWFSSNVPTQAKTPPTNLEAIEWARQLPEKAIWNQDLSSVPGSYPISNDLTVNAVAWSPFETEFDPDAVVYDHTPPGLEKTYVFVLKLTEEADRSIFPNHPKYRASNFSAATSCDGNHLFMLVVMGDSGVYRDRVKQSIGIVSNQSRLNGQAHSTEMVKLLSDIDLWLTTVQSH